MIGGNAHGLLLHHRHAARGCAHAARRRFVARWQRSAAGDPGPDNHGAAGAAQEGGADHEGTSTGSCSEDGHSSRLG